MLKYIMNMLIQWIQFSSVTQSCLTLFYPMDCSTPGLPVLHHLLELAQTHVHWVSDVIQLSHPLSSPSPPAFSLSQHQGLFKWVGSFQMNRFFASGSQSIGASASASVLPMNIQDWFPLGWTGLILQSKGLSRVFSKTTVQKHFSLGMFFQFLVDFFQWSTEYIYSYLNFFPYRFWKSVD